MEYAIAHHGIQGQKWGVRRYQNPDGSLTEAGRKRYGYKTTYQEKKAERDARWEEEQRKAEAKQIKKERRTNAKYVSTMSDEELKQALNRIDLEKKYQKSQITTGEEMAKDIMKNVGTKVATTVISGAALYAISAAVEGTWDPVKLANAMFNGGPKKK